MCRGTNNGDRRCPSHRSEAKQKERNARRRELYQDKKKSNTVASTLSLAGIPFISGENFGSTYFQEKDGSGFIPEKFEPVKNKAITQELIDFVTEFNDGTSLAAALSSSAKPDSGGFWTAPATSTENGLRTSWSDWAHEEDFRTVKESFIEVKPKKYAVIVRCDSVDDLTKICERWPGYPIDFEAMAEAGVHGLSLSQKAISEAKRLDFNSLHRGFAIWDVDSTVWLNPIGFEAHKKVAAAVYEPKPREDYDEYDDDDSVDVMDPEYWKTL